jgi:hypothetical protein
MRVPMRWAARVCAAGFLFVMPLVPPAQAGFITDITLQAAAPAGYSGTLINNAWTPDDALQLPGFAQVTLDLAPADDYYVGVVGGGWNFETTGGTAPNYAQGCNASGCTLGWLNLFFVLDDRGNVPVGFSDPSPFSDDSSHFPTAAAALAAAQWHQFDVFPNLLPGGPLLIPVTFYIYDVDYTDNLGDLTLALYEGLPPDPTPGGDPLLIPEPPAWSLFGAALLGFLLIGRFREARGVSPSALG